VLLQGWARGNAEVRQLAEVLLQGWARGNAEVRQLANVLLRSQAHGDAKARQLADAARAARQGPLHLIHGGGPVLFYLDAGYAPDRDAGNARIQAG
jgi:hypothetical protein